MRILRNIAGTILACEAVALVIAVPWILHHLGGRFPGSRLELWLTFLLASGFVGIAALQVYRERPGCMALIASLFSAFFFHGVLRIGGSIPLLYVLVHCAQVVWRKWRKPVQTTTPPPRPAEPGHAPAESAAQPTRTPPDEGSGILGTIVDLVALFSYRAIWGMLPAWLLPVVPADGHAWGWASFLLGVTLTTFFHELGHAAAGRLAGFRMIQFAVYPFDYVRTSKHHYFRLNFKLPAAGMYAGIPTSLENLQPRYVFKTASGPVAGIAFSVLCWIALMLAEGRITGLWFGVLNTAMSFGLLTNALNLLPFKSNGLRLDGRILWDALFDRPAAVETVVMLGCCSSMRSDLRPRDWPADWVAHLRRCQSDILALALLSHSAEDRLTASPTDPEARRDLELASESYLQLPERLKEDPKARAVFEFHRCWLRCRYFGEKVSANFTAAQADRETDPFEILRLQAALAAVEGDSTRAVELLTQAEASLATNLKHGIDAADLDALRAFREELLASGPGCSLAPIGAGKSGEQ